MMNSTNNNVSSEMRINGLLEQMLSDYEEYSYVEEQDMEELKSLLDSASENTKKEVYPIFMFYTTHVREWEPV